MSVPPPDAPRRGASLASAVIAALTLAPMACDNARPQLLLEVTSDLAVPSQVLGDRALAPAGSFDRVRVETLGPDGAPTTTRDFVIDGESSFPFSFGVAAPSDPSRELVVRITAFKARFARVSGDVTSPLRYARVERLITLVPNGVDEVKVALLGACLGSPADVAKRTSCIDADTLAGAPGPSTTSAVPGSFGPLRATPCRGSSAPDRVCVPGGLGLVGAPLLVSDERDRVGAEPRLVTLSPFALGKREITVAALRTAFASGLVADKPTTRAQRAACNYSETAGSADTEAARCVSFATARAACRALGGDLPTAAQWEYAARGRGEARTFVWGETEPSCCAAALAGGALGCRPSLVTGSFADPSACEGIADVSRDGALDLAGGVREWVLDDPRPLAECAPSGLARDPVCGAGGSLMGGSFAQPLTRAAAALRFRADSLDDVGFRCAFQDR